KGCGLAVETDAAIRKLESAGLIVIPRVLPLEDFSFGIARSRIPSGKISHFKDVSRIYFENEMWGFRKWEWVPGPGPDDIDFQAETLERIVNCALNYYFGKPTIINGWIIPVNKHPEWSAERLNSVLERAKQVTSEEWKTIRDEYIRL